MEMIIGVDLDNTIVSYDRVLYTIALKRKLIPAGLKQSKKAIRDYVRTLSQGEREWQKLQAYVYGPGMVDASLLSGVKEFFSECKKRGIPLRIISHKTKYANYDVSKTDLRKAAMDWLGKNGLVEHYVKRKNVYFCPSREEKLKQIRACKCTHFIDDLKETFDEANFPSHVEKILFDPHEDYEKGSVPKMRSWKEISSYLFSLSLAEERREKQLLQKIVKDTITFLRPLGGGRNSRVWLVECGAKKKVVKKYHTKDRLSTEFSSLEFLWNNGIKEIPRPLSYDQKHHLALYSYIEGEIATRRGVDKKDIDAVLLFIKKLDGLKRKSRAQPAADAYFSFKEVSNHLHQRRKRLQKVEEKNKHLQLFLKQFDSLLEEVMKWSKRCYYQHGLSEDEQLKEEYRTLSPSDFGFHNAMRTSDTLMFLDFEYFGWDDPAKLISDFLLHPQMNVSTELQKYFVQESLNYFSSDKNLRIRLQALFPLFGCKWCLIMLNEFLPQELKRRKFAGVKKQEQVIKAEQLKKAQMMLSRIRKSFKEFPYFE